MLWCAIGVVFFFFLQKMKGQFASVVNLILHLSGDRSICSFKMMFFLPNFWS